MIHLREIRIERGEDSPADVYPFHVPPLRDLDRVELATPITFLVGNKVEELFAVRAGARVGTVFCSNGSHHNPETEVIEAYINSRLGTPSQRSTNPEVDQPFTFWFTYDPDVNTLTTNQKDQMDAVKRLIQQTAATEPRMKFEFVAGDEGLIDLDGG